MSKQRKLIDSLVNTEVRVTSVDGVAVEPFDAAIKEISDIGWYLEISQHKKESRRDAEGKLYVDGRTTHIFASTLSFKVIEWQQSQNS